MTPSPPQVLERRAGAGARATLGWVGAWTRLGWVGAWARLGWVLGTKGLHKMAWAGSGRQKAPQHGALGPP